MELEDEVTSVQDEEVPADLDSQQEPKDLVDGEFDLAYLELASSTARLNRMHMVAATLSFTLRIVNVSRVGACVIIRRKAWINFETDFSEVSEFEATSKRSWHVGDSDIVVLKSECKVFNPGPDEWDLDTLSFVSQLMNGFHGVNGTAASDTHWLS